MTEKLTHHELTAELFTDDQGVAIMLTQAHECDEPDSVILHPWQLRAVCEQFGLTPASDAQASKTIATLQRRMQAIRDRVEFLHNYLCNHSDHKHADLSYEVTYATATLDLADEFCADFSSDADEAHAQPMKPEANKQGATETPDVAAKDLFN